MSKKSSSQTFKFALVGFLISLLGQVWSCDQDAVQRCESSSFPAGPPDFKGIPRADEINEICSPFLNFKRCTDPLIASCDNQVLPNVMDRSYRTVAEAMCEEYYNEILSTSDCWNKDDVQSAMSVCATSHRITTNVFLEECSQLRALYGCTSKAISSKCGEHPMEIMEKILHMEGSAITYPNQCDWTSSSGVTACAGSLVMVVSLLVSLVKLLE